MNASNEFQRVFDEVRLLMQVEFYEAAHHAVGELIDLATSSEEIAAAYSIEDYLVEKLEEDF